MQYSILCVGKIKEKYFTDAVSEYEKRMSRYGKIQIREVSDEKTKEDASLTEEEMIREKEAKRILSCIKPGMYVVALDLRGREYDSVSFSGHLDSLMTRGKSHLAFVIGGSLGLHKTVLERADECISFSKMTFPHQLMRVILMEQIYRANRIRNHEPYHK